ncbi:MAG: hypothetical protein HYT50_01000 [Candidatus Wildermuthbacteria bacterium]|nr:hypothetical protein [Candidatus Wildermuthbacteria bacterium]
MGQTALQSVLPCGIPWFIQQGPALGKTAAKGEFQGEADITFAEKGNLGHTVIVRCTAVQFSHEGQRRELTGSIPTDDGQMRFQALYNPDTRRGLCFEIFPHH